MIPLALITGFLGSGKTTLLRRVIEANRGRKLACLVNEFSPLDIDGRRLGEVSDSVICLPGGSIFCRCLVTAFINQLKDIAELHDDPPGSLEGLVIEASGIADPRVVGRLLEETRLDQVYRLGRVVSIVDPGTFEKLLHTLPNIAAQVEASDLAIVNKADLFDEAALGRTEAAIRSIQPAIRVVRASYCQADVDLFTSVTHPRIGGEYAPCRDEHYATETFATDRPVDLDRFIRQAAALGEDLYRLKGFAWTGRDRMYIESGATGVEVRPAAGAGERTELALIFRPAARPRIEAPLRP